MSDDMRQELNGVKAELAEVKETLKGVVAGIGELKDAVSGIGELKDAVADVGELKRDVAELKHDVAEMRPVKDVVKRIAITTSGISADLGDFKKYVHENMVTRDEFHERMSGYARRVEDFDYRLAKQGERLGDFIKGGKKS